MAALSNLPLSLSLLSPFPISPALSLSLSLLPLPCCALQINQNFPSWLSALREPRSQKEGRGLLPGWGVGRTPTNRFSNSGVIWPGREGIRGAVAPSGVQIGGIVLFSCAPRSGGGGKCCYFLAIEV